MHQRRSEATIWVLLLNGGVGSQVCNFHQHFGNEKALFDWGSLLILS
jgi:hypothetical protein